MICKSLGVSDDQRDLLLSIVKSEKSLRRKRPLHQAVTKKYKAEDRILMDWETLRCHTDDIIITFDLEAGSIACIGKNEAVITKSMFNRCEGKNKDGKNVSVTITNDHQILTTPRIESLQCWAFAQRGKVIWKSIRTFDLTDSQASKILRDIDFRLAPAR